MILHSVDVSTVLLLAAVLWLDGWRRVPPDALLLRKTGAGPWCVAEPWARLGAFALVGLWPPAVMPFVVPSGGATERSGDVARWTGDFTVSVARARRRVRRVAVAITGLRVAGLVLTVWIVGAIPLATARSGLRGLLLGILGAFCLATWMAIVAGDALRLLGVRWRGALEATLLLVSPFSAIRAAEVVIDHASGGAPALARVAALLGDDSFRAWLRPHAYDALHAPAAASVRPQLAAAVASVPRAQLTAALAAPSADGGAGDGDGDAYCPRCATAYERSVVACAGCSGVVLVER